MPIVIGTDPTKAFSDLGRVEKELRSMIKRNGGTVRPTASSVSKGRRNDVRYTGRIREAISGAVELSTMQIAGDIQSESPRWSYWLRSNFNHIQGERPNFGITPTPEDIKKGQFSDFAGSIVGSVNLDGTKAQYIYNTVVYADDVAIGEFPGISAPLDWYLSIEQFHAAGNYFRDALKVVKRS